jgi:uncharacterized protein involved in exopolysaccharide biosynthesis
METVQHNKKTDPVIDFPRLWATLVRRKKTYFKVIPTVILVVWIISLGLPDYYKCKIQLAPEEDTGGSAGTLAMLASSFGVNLGGGSQSSDAITVMLYPDLLNSVEFKTSLFNIQVKRPTDKASMTYYDYLKYEQKEAWWLSAKESLLGLFHGKKEEKRKSQPIDPFELTPEQAGISGMINSRIACDIVNSVEKVKSLITVEVTDQDPYVAAIVADSVKVHLQNYITDYKTKKARYDLEFTEKLYKDAKKSYERARQLYADYMDSNHDVIVENVRQKQTDLENEMQLRYNNYNAVSTQLLAAKVRVQEVTPAFTTLQAATVPLWPSGPNRSRLVVLFTIAALFFTTIWILFDEDEIRPLLGLTEKTKD